ncbi:MAG: CHAT domain-containing protein, partial [Bacteroidales bacterium]|nr:CHAT domain-containing protein [Bacteroidales bacterium]
EYAMPYGNLYTLSVSRTGSAITRVPLTSESESNIAYLIEFMKGYPESLDSKARNLYCHAASELYKLLIGAADSYSDSKNLLIIPDGSLSYLPFEALLKPQIEPYKQDYRKLPYLIHCHSVCYGLTATIFFNKPTRKTNPTRRILAVAPEYNFSSGKISEYIRKAQPGLPELSGTYEESRAIRKLLGGRLLSGDKATEEKFKSIAPRYAILHLAMHSIPDHTNSLNSSLVFTPGADQDEDGVLFGYEVYNMSLNSSLTVLSACETGSGQMASGEGVLSFGRAFISAGCPNLIMTLWTVDDRSSKDIMIQFYKSLVSGSKISDALHDSKIGYLEHADKLHAHPHYWAGFIELGQNTELNISYRKSGIFILVVVFSLTILVLIYVQAKKNPRRSRDMLKKWNSRKL